MAPADASQKSSILSPVHPMPRWLKALANGSVNEFIGTSGVLVVHLLSRALISFTSAGKNSTP